MIRYINRDWTRTEYDDFVLNVEPMLSKTTEAVPQYVDEQMMGWIIQYRGE